MFLTRAMLMPPLKESADNRDPSPLRWSVMRYKLTHASSTIACRGGKNQPMEEFSRLVLLTITVVCSPLSLFINLILNKVVLLPCDIHHYCRKSSAWNACHSLVQENREPYSSNVLLALAALKPSEFWDAVRAVAAVPKLLRCHVFAELGSARLVPQSWCSHRDC